jgi:biopolymer transport protein ExbD
MAFGGFRQEAGAAPMAEINMIPLIDVMLVLLVIFIITAPLLTHAVKLDLPKASSQPNLTKPEHIGVAIDGSGQLYWNGERIDRKRFQERVAVAAKQKPQPEIHLRADRATRYQEIAEVMADATNAGMGRIGFVSEPESRPTER